MTDQPTCGYCRFQERGECRRHSATLGANSAYGTFPKINVDRDWCGDYEANLKPTDRNARVGQINAWDIPDGAAVDARGNEYRNIRTLARWAEEYECVTKCLDDVGVPVTSMDHHVYSLWGRILKFKLMAGDEFRHAAHKMLAAKPNELRWHAEQLAVLIGCNGPYTEGFSAAMPEPRDSASNEGTSPINKQLNP